MSFDFDAGIQCLARMASGALNSGKPSTYHFQRLPSLLETWGKLHRELTRHVEYTAVILLYETQSQLVEDLEQLTSLPPAKFAVLNPKPLLHPKTEHRGATLTSLSTWCQQVAAQTKGQTAPRLDGPADGVKCPPPLSVDRHQVVFWQDPQLFDESKPNPLPSVEKWMKDQLKAGSKEKPTVMLVCAEPIEMGILDKHPPTGFVDFILLDDSVGSAERVKSRGSRQSAETKRAKGPASTNGDILEKVKSKCELRFSGMWTLPTLQDPPAAAPCLLAAPPPSRLRRPESEKTKQEKAKEEARAESIDRGNRSRRWFPPPGPEMASMMEPTFFDNVYSSFVDFDFEGEPPEKYDAWKGQRGDSLVEAMGRVQCRPVPPARIKEVVENMRDAVVQKDFVRCMFRYAVGYLSGSEGSERAVTYEDALNRVRKCLRWQRQRWGDLLEPALRGTDLDDMAALEAAVPFDTMRLELYERSQKLIRS